jgi:hypothetical protein
VKNFQSFNQHETLAVLSQLFRRGNDSNEVEISVPQGHLSQAPLEKSLMSSILGLIQNFVEQRADPQLSHKPASRLAYL